MYVDRCGRENIEFKSVSFRADIGLKKNLKERKIRRSRNKPHSMPMTETEIDEKLTEHFSNNPILTRRDFQFLCVQVKPTACRILKKLVEDGKLKNISTPHSPVYVPDNGHYAPVLGEWHSVRAPSTCFLLIHWKLWGGGRSVWRLREIIGIRKNNMID